MKIIKIIVTNKWNTIYGWNNNAYSGYTIVDDAGNDLGVIRDKNDDKGMYSELTFTEFGHQKTNRWFDGIKDGEYRSFDKLKKAISENKNITFDIEWRDR